jgi:hypothetical protein
VRDTLDAIIDAETSADDEEDEPGIITPDDMRLAEMAGLHDEAHLRIFTLWHTFGGTQRGLAPMEIAVMPASMMDDFIYLSSELAKRRRRRKRRLSVAKTRKRPNDK